ncbi:hypothetical protein LMG27198_19500 [Methylocystis echinoides]|uniref:Uncharacterized protein n=1 Tax=Methylocystis echinoides TaxID=29468 RepID=A0A9W6GU35_9HYPH|nr:hypothetical protein LMG27198_19500 [Methylocystis echinoides]
MAAPALRQRAAERAIRDIMSVDMGIGQPSGSLAAYAGKCMIGARMGPNWGGRLQGA